MKGDFTRSTFRPQRHFRNVLIQQGRVQTDADLNEQADLTAHRAEVGNADVIGSCGAPLENAGFGLLNGATPRLTAGHFYVDGILCENDTEIALDRQPDLPGFSLPTIDGFYLAYLDAFEEHVTALEDPLLREVALGGPDTATRQRTTWQVRMLGPFPEFRCSTPLPDWNALLTRPLGGLRARTNPGSVSNDPCIISPGGGFRRLENQLYRVEIHTAGNRGTARFKWSRDNGSIVTSWKDQQGSDLVVGSIGRDHVLGFAPGQTIELIDHARELRGEAGILVRLSSAEGQMLTMDSTDPAAATVDKANFPDLNSLGAPNQPKARRWDSDGTLATGADWVALEDGVEVSFEPGNYRVGDYWLVPARTATDDVEWPREADGDPIAQSPHGVRHHYCKLAVVRRQAGSFTVVEDCRPLFPSLTSLLQFSYLGGDGQESLPGAPLPEPLRVGVTLGGLPVGTGPLAGYHYQVQFTTADGGSITPAQPMPIVNGIAECTWQLATGNGSRATLAGLRSQTVTARLLDSAGADTGLTPIIFNASLSLSSQVEYQPGEHCEPLSGVTTVEQAIDRLCIIHQVGGRCCVTVGEGGDFVTLAQALQVLIERGEKHLNLCFLPGEHQTDAIDIQIPSNVLAHLRIQGGANAVLRARGPWVLNHFATISMENLNLSSDQIGNSVPFLHFQNCGRVIMRDCQFSGFAGTGVMLGIEALTDVLLENCQFDVLRRFSTGAGAFTGTALEEALALDNLSNSVVLASALAGTNLATMRTSDRRAFSTAMRAFVDTNAGTLDERETSSLLSIADAVGRRRVDAEEVSAIAADIAVLFTIAGRALYIAAPRAQVVLRSNQILGEIAFYGTSPATASTDEQIMELLQMVGNNIDNIEMRAVGGSMELNGNRFGAVACSQTLLTLFRTIGATGGGVIPNLANMLNISENTFTDPNAVFVAKYINMQHNIFPVSNLRYRAACFAESGIYIGNRGSGGATPIRTTHVEGNKLLVANMNLSVA